MQIMKLSSSHCASYSSAACHVPTLPCIFFRPRQIRFCVALQIQCIYICLFETRGANEVLLRLCICHTVAASVARYAPFMRVLVGQKASTFYLVKKSHWSFQKLKNGIRHFFFPHQHKTTRQDKPRPRIRLLRIKAQRKHNFNIYQQWNN